jgi:hypothetical protein
LTALEDLDAEVNVNSALETIAENINITANNLGCYELKKHKSYVVQRRMFKIIRTKKTS